MINKNHFEKVMEGSTHSRLHGYELWAGGTSLPTRIKKSQNMFLHHFAFQPAAFYLLLSNTTYEEIAQLPGAHWKSLWIEALLRHLS